MKEKWKVCETRTNTVYKNREQKVVTELKEEGRLTAVYIMGSVKENSPDFGYQDSFQIQNSIEVDLEIPAESKFVSVYQHKEWWVRPCFGKTFREIPENTQLLIRYVHGTYEIFLAVCGEECRADLKGWEKGITVSLSGGCIGKRRIFDLAFIYGYGENPYALIEEAAELALRETHKP